MSDQRQRTAKDIQHDIQRFVKIFRRNPQGLNPQVVADITGYDYKLVVSTMTRSKLFKIIRRENKEVIWTLKEQESELATN